VPMLVLVLVLLLLVLVFEPPAYMHALIDAYMYYRASGVALDWHVGFVLEPHAYTHTDTYRF
jgi:hypothetical protein